ncbi:MAG: NAD(P)-dependent oxidoreductase [Acidobacteriaceae bacterium]|nr:NAD(P)-dependent oxidoreductase [Acidobacteriaceae bacterium]
MSATGSSFSCAGVTKVVGAPILVTGGAGYLGSTLVHLLLEAGYSVRVLDSLRYGGESLLGAWTHPRFELLVADVRDEAAVRCAVQGIGTVVHLAAVVGDPACAREPDEAMTTNVDGSELLLRACMRSEVRRFIFASTCSNYGQPLAPTVAMGEESPLRPVSLYAETKVQFESSLLNSITSSAMSATVLRFASLFGVSRRMRFDLTLNEFALAMVVQKHLVVFGEQAWRPHLHVYDAACAICKVLAVRESTAGQIYNVGDNNQNHQKIYLLDVLRRYVPDAEVEFTSSRQDQRNYCVRFDKIQNELGFRATRNVDSGARELVHLLRSGAIRQPEAVWYRN